MAGTDPIHLSDCTLLGGSYYRLRTGPGVLLTFHADEVTVQVSNAAIRPACIPYVEIVSLNIDGPGQVTSGGGFAGGGFGLAGALSGMAISAVLNAATTNTSIHTFVQILTLRGEMFFHWGGMEPAQLRMSPSTVFTRLRQLDLGTSLAQLERVAALRARAMITEEEFLQFKALIIGQHAAIPSPPQTETPEQTAPSRLDRPSPSWPVRAK